MKINHALHIALFVGITFILALVLMYLSGSGGGYWYTLGFMVPYLVLPFAIIFIGIILYLVKRPRWKTIYTIAWVIYGLVNGLAFAGQLL